MKEQKRREEQKKFYEKQLCDAGIHSYDNTTNCKCLRCGISKKNSNI